jgi:hypothetical protein
MIQRVYSDVSLLLPQAFRNILASARHTRDLVIHDKNFNDTAASAIRWELFSNIYGIDLRNCGLTVIPIGIVLIFLTT